MNKRFLADLAERALKTFVQAFVGFWLAFQDVEPDTFLTWENLRAALVVSAMSVLTSLASKPFNNHDSASVLPPEAQPVAPQPPDAPDVPLVDPGQTAEEQMASLLALARQIQPVAAQPPPVTSTLAPPARAPLGLLDPNLVGGRDPLSEGNT